MTGQTSKDLIELLGADIENTSATFDSYRSVSNPKVVVFVPTQAAPPFRFKAGGWELVQRSIDLGPGIKARVAEKGFFMCRLVEEEPGWIELNDLAVPPSA